PRSRPAFRTSAAGRQAYGHSRSAKKTARSRTPTPFVRDHAAAQSPQRSGARGGEFWIGAARARTAAEPVDSQLSTPLLTPMCQRREKNSQARAKAWSASDPAALLLGGMNAVIPDGDGPAGISRRLPRESADGNGTRPALTRLTFNLHASDIERR